jgi:hypothetical protein
MGKSFFSFLNIFGKTKKRRTVRKRRGSKKTQKNQKKMRGG